MRRALTWTLGAVIVPAIVSAAVALAIMGGMADRVRPAASSPTPVPQSAPEQVHDWAVQALEALDGAGTVIDLASPPDATAAREALAAAEAAHPSVQLQRAANTNGEAAIEFERARQGAATARAKAFAELDTYLARYGLSRQTLNEEIAQRSAAATRGPLPTPTSTPDSVANATAAAEMVAAIAATVQAAPGSTATAQAVSTEAAIAADTAAPANTATAQAVRMANATLEAAPAATEQAVMMGGRAISAAQDLAYALRREAQSPDMDFIHDNAVYELASATAEAEANPSPQGQALRELLEPARRAIETRDPTELARVAVALERTR